MNRLLLDGFLGENLVPEPTQQVQEDDEGGAAAGGRVRGRRLGRVRGRRRLGRVRGRRRLGRPPQPVDDAVADVGQRLGGLAQSRRQPARRLRPAAFGPAFGPRPAAPPHGRPAPTPTTTTTTTTTTGKPPIPCVCVCVRDAVCRN